MPPVTNDPWPWYVAGPLIGLFVPALLLYGGKVFGLSASLRHACAAALPHRVRPEFLRYDWRRAGLWNIVFALGIGLGGFLSLRVWGDPGDALSLSPDTVAALQAIGVVDLRGFIPADFFSWPTLLTGPGLLTVVAGGFLVGFGARWAGGCTSGHAISGLASFQLPSLVAVFGFFAGGLLVTHVLLPLLF